VKKIQVFDPPMCCPTGVCGPDVDPTLPWFAGVLSQLAEAGVDVERYNLAQEPMAFVRNAAVKALLDQHGTEALPAILIDGEIVCQGAYPDKAVAATWIATATKPAQA